MKPRLDISKTIKKFGEEVAREERNRYNREYQKRRKASDPEFLAKVRASTVASNKKRYHSDPEFKTKVRLYEKITRLMKVVVAMKRGSIVDPIGCSVLQWIEHLESQFTADMNWDNYGKHWELDHSDPVCAGGSWNYRNIRPLERAKNRAKIKEDRLKSKTGRVKRYA